MKKPYPIGTWIRFYHLGELKLDEVRYIDESFDGQSCYLTNKCGHVDHNSVIEARPPISPASPGVEQ